METVRRFKFHFIASALLIALAALIACSPAATPATEATATPRPASDTPAPESLAEPPAFVELADGTRCAFAGKGATLAFDGKRLNYTCETDGEDEVGLLGDLMPAGDGWTAEKAIIGHNSDGFFVKESEIVTVRIVE